MDKTNQFRSSDFFMAVGDVLHMIIEDTYGTQIDIVLVGDEVVASAPSPVVALAATDVGSSGFTANWLFTENATGYYFNLATDPDMTPHISGYDHLDVGNVNQAVITGLTAGVVYYYQLSAYNSVGEGLLSNVISQLVLNTVPLEDLDGNQYTSVVIGNQEWLIQNLKTTKYADGSSIPNITASGTSTAYTDWFLPSKNELLKMYKNLKSGSDDNSVSFSPVGSFSNIWYNSSSEYAVTPTLNEAVDFTDGTNYQSSKGVVNKVRACRSFTAGIGDYVLRDIGPAGGYVFYISGTTYYEAAPNDCVDSAFSNITTAIGSTSSAIGAGQTNTNAIISQVGETSSAANLCDVLSVGYGGTGWIADTSGAYCWYNNDISNKTPYGALYNWYAVSNAKGLVYLERGSTQETGWRVPTIADFNKLTMTVDGFSVGGGNLKESGTSHWATPNVGANNNSGFTGLPAGVRRNSGTFDEITVSTQMWGSDKWNFSLSTYDASIATADTIGFENDGFSVRCVRDIYVATVYVTFTDPSDPSVLWRKGVRSGALRVDVTLTALGFSGIEGIDWENIKTISG
jgi:uncharacterized protein (TIGR02145 family)